MPNVRLTESRVAALEARNSPYDIRDTELKGFGIRILPSGRKRYFIHSQYEGQRLWKTVGDANAMGLNEARRRATQLLAAIRRDEVPALPEERLFEAVAEEVFRRYGRNWKPGTLKVNRNYLRNQILPSFRGRNIADITRRDVQNWFASLRATPVAADRSAPVLSVIMRQAEIYGYRSEGSNPCTGIRRYRRKGRERFLSETEFRRLGRTLDCHEERYWREAALVRLLLLTGCRVSEIATLQWPDYREGRLFLPDSKTGPRTVLLNADAQAILMRRMAYGSSPWVFSSVKDPSRHQHCGLPLWYVIRAETGIGDVRLHDLRHTVASQATLAGVPLTVTARLLGHSDVRMTIRYAHVGDREVEAAAERVGQAIDAMMGRTRIHGSEGDGFANLPDKAR